MQVRQSTKVRPAVTTALILAAGLSSVSCDRADPHQHALASGSAKLQANSGGAFAAPYESVQKKNYQDTIEIAKPVASLEEKSPQSAAASALVGTAQLGKAQSLLDEAAVMEQAAIGRATLLRVSLDNWIAYSFSADTAQGFDPTDVLASIDAARAESDREVQALQSKLQDVERRLADFRSRSKSKFEEADKFAVEYAKARESLATLSASEAESRLASAREERRKGDAIRVEASRLQAQADVTQPEADELKVLITATQNRIASLDREKLEISERAQQGRAAAAQSRSSAAETAKQIETGLADLASARNSGVIAKYDEAIAALRTAATSAKAASADATAGGKVLVGRTQLALAGALAAKASSLKSYSSFLHQFAAANPPLPFAAALEAPQKDAAEQIRIATDDAKAAFEAAQSAFSSVQLRGQGAAAIKDRMTQLAEAIGALAGQSAPAPTEQAAPSDQPAPAEPAAQPPADSSSTPPTAAASPDSDAQAAWKQIYAALDAGDTAAAMPLVKLLDPAHEASIAVVLNLKFQTNELNAACTEKFGVKFIEMMREATGKPNPPDVDSTVVVEGDTAVVSNPSFPEPLKLVRQDGKWLIESTSVLTPQATQLLPFAPKMSDVSKALAADIRAGTVTKEQVLPEFQKRAAASMQSGGG
ncbi:MAG: hypothetical protein JNM86_03485 [Phycisphaerae bacterium]|nr:hypothetical protein [Phycisphaerae bacterium]